jgi:hypothetical protein
LIDLRKRDDDGSWNKNFANLIKEEFIMKVYETIKTGLAALLMTAVLMTGCAKNPLGPDTTDTVKPTVVSTVPAGAATGVAVNASLTATFSEAISTATVSTATFTLKQGATPVPCVVTYANKVATLNPTGDLAGFTTYTATITTIVKDLAGNSLAVNKTWSFTTGATPDTTAPVVNSTLPVDLAAGVAIAGNVTATFSEAMTASTINAATFNLSQGATPVPCAVSYAGNDATLNPTSDLAYSTTYTATITTAAQDLAGNPLAVALIWTFTTGAAPVAGPLPVNLGLAGGFVILAESGIDTVPTSVVTGDIGVSPAAASFITGFSLVLDASTMFATSSQIVGSAYAADYSPPTPSNLTTAVNDMYNAYVDAAGRPTPDVTELGAGEIGGLTLVPGLYKWGTGVSISANVTLSGGPNDVWIFQIAQGITVAPGVQVLLAGGALPKNIFWQAASTVFLDTTSHFEGVVLCQTAINLATGATVNGRLLSQTAVNIDGSTVTQPAP